VTHDLAFQLAHSMTYWTGYTPSYFRWHNQKSCCCHSCRGLIYVFTYYLFDDIFNS